MKVFTLTPQTIKQALAQHARCDICGVRLNLRTAHTDFDDQNGDVTGVICQYCDAALDEMGNNPDHARGEQGLFEYHGDYKRAQRAATYLVTFGYSRIFR